MKKIRAAWREFELIQGLRRRAGRSRDLLGIGDDAAARRTVPGRIELVTVDSLIEGIHWDFRWIDPYSLGRKAAAVNLSDIAAMGGTPERAYLAWALPRSMTRRVSGRVADGLLDEFERWGVRLCGGDTTASPGPLVLSITLQGWVAPGRLLTRSGARPGDVLLMTGEAGGAAAGLAIASLKSGRDSWRAPLLNRLLRPEPRLIEGQWLAASGVVHAMLDLSDGLSGDARRLAEASRTGIRLYAANIPVALATRLAASRLRRKAVDWAVTGGEDYELLLACAPHDAAALIAGLPKATGTPCSLIGEVVSAKRGLTVLWPNGQETALPAGYEHGPSGDPR